MNCSECGQEVSAGDRFCQNCGAEVSAGPAACPGCGAEISPDLKFCGQCGQSLIQEKSAVAAPVAAVEPSAGVKASVPFLQLPFLKQTAVVATGAILTLISLGLSWYTTAIGTIKASELLAPGESASLVWAGWGLPVMLLIIIAALVLMSIAGSLWTRAALKRFWMGMGIFAILCVAGNAGYVGWWTDDMGIFSGGLVHAGFVLAMIGSIAMLVGAIMIGTQPVRELKRR